MFEDRICCESKHTLQNVLELLFTGKFYGLHRCQSIELPYLLFLVLINEKQSVVAYESIYVTYEDIETDTCHIISAQFCTFLYKCRSIADLSAFLRTLELILTKDSLTDVEKIAVQTWISKVVVHITMCNYK